MEPKMHPIAYYIKGRGVFENWDIDPQDLPSSKALREAMYTEGQIREMLKEMVAKVDHRLNNMHVILSEMTEDSLKESYEKYAQGFSDSENIITRTALKYGIKID